MTDKQIGFSSLAI